MNNKMNQMKRNEGDKKFNRILGGIIAFAAIIIFSTLRYDFGEDEIFYVCCSYRISAGSIPCIESFTWDFFGILLSPFIKLYTYFTGGTEGILLFCRYIFLLFQVIVSIVVLLLSGKQTRIMFYGIMIYLSVMPYNINTFNTNTIPMASFLLILLILICYEESFYNGLVIGIIFSFAVIANPFYMLLYLVYLAVYIGIRLIRHLFNSTFEIKWFCFETIKGITCGGIIVGCVVLVYYFVNGISLNDIVVFANYVVNSDATHGTSIGLIITKILDCLKVVKRLYLIQLSILFTILILYYSRVKFKFLNIKENIGLFIMISTVVEGFFLFNKAQNAQMAFHSVSHYLIFSLFISLLLYNVIVLKDIKIFYIQIFGMVAFMCSLFATNTGLNTPSVAIAPFVAWIVILVFEHYQNINLMNKIFMYIFYSAFIILLLSIRTYCGWHEPISKCDTFNNRGPTKGIYTTKERWDSINEDYNILDMFDYKNQDIIFEFDDKYHATSFLYLNAKGVGPGQQDKSVSQMYEKYYTLKKDSIPNLVMIYHPENDNTKYLIEMCKDIGYECKNINHIMVYYNKSLLKN